jgi:serine O-acetyltransferase
MMPGFQALMVYRFGHWLLNQSGAKRFFLGPLYSRLQHRVWKKWGMDISPKAEIGQGVLIIHFGGIFIGQATIGKMCSIHHDTTIGLGGSGLRRGIPSIGDNVFIAPGAVIAGKIRIGSNVRIGSNAVVQRDIPDNALVQVRPIQVVRFPVRRPKLRENSQVTVATESH